MHPDVVLLLELQERDEVVSEIDLRLKEVESEVTQLDEAVEEMEHAAVNARKAAEDAAVRRGELEAKIENYRVQQERRRQRLEMTRPGREAATLMAELDLARSVLAQEESEWARLAGEVEDLEARAEEAVAEVEKLRESQAEQRTELAGKIDSISGERERALAERSSRSEAIDKNLVIKYDRLRAMRASKVVVPLNGPACGACFTSVPIHRRAQIKAGSVLASCEACGVILYVADEVE